MSGENPASENDPDRIAQRRKVAAWVHAAAEDCRMDEEQDS